MSFLKGLRLRLYRLQASHWLYLSLHAVVLVLGLLFVSFSGVLWASVGASLVAASIAGLVLFLYVWLSESRFRRFELFERFGLIEAFPARSVRIKDEYDQRLIHATEAIDIMGFGLRHLRQDYHNDFRAWSSRARVRILLLDPEFPEATSPLANLRDKEEKDAPGTIAADVRSFVKACAEVISKRGSKFHVRLYRCLPSVNIFRIDDELFWGPYLVGDVSRNFPTLLVQSNGSLYARLLAHFEAIWSDDALSRPIPQEWL